MGGPRTSSGGWRLCHRLGKVDRFALDGAAAVMNMQYFVKLGDYTGSQRCKGSQGSTQPDRADAEREEKFSDLRKKNLYPCAHETTFNVKTDANLTHRNIDKLTDGYGKCRMSSFFVGDVAEGNDISRVSEKCVL